MGVKQIEKKKRTRTEWISFVLAVQLCFCLTFGDYISWFSLCNLSQVT